MSFLFAKKREHSVIPFDSIEDPTVSSNSGAKKGPVTTLTTAQEQQINQLKTQTAVNQFVSTFKSINGKNTNVQDVANRRIAEIKCNRKDGLYNNGCTDIIVSNYDPITKRPKCYYSLGNLIDCPIRTANKFCVSQDLIFNSASGECRNKRAYNKKNTSPDLQVDVKTSATVKGDDHIKNSSTTEDIANNMKCNHKFELYNNANGCETITQTYINSKTDTLMCLSETQNIPCPKIIADKLCSKQGFVFKSDNCRWNKTNLTITVLDSPRVDDDINISCISYNKEGTVKIVPCDQAKGENLCKHWIDGKKGGYKYDPITNKCINTKLEQLKRFMKSDNYNCPQYSETFPSSRRNLYINTNPYPYRVLNWCSLPPSALEVKVKNPSSDMIYSVRQLDGVCYDVFDASTKCITYADTLNSVRTLVGNACNGKECIPVVKKCYGNSDFKYGVCAANVYPLNDEITCIERGMVYDTVRRECKDSNVVAGQGRKA